MDVFWTRDAAEIFRIITMQLYSMLCIKLGKVLGEVDGNVADRAANPMKICFHRRLTREKANGGQCTSIGQIGRAHV